MHLCRNFNKVKNKSGQIVRLVIILAASVFFNYCANQVAPGGGPIDIIPPDVVKCDPPNFSTSFSKRRIQLTFNEFVELKQANQQIIVSPPMKNQPDYRLSGKSLIIDLNEELIPLTTYSIFFGNAIADITEGNPLKDFLYVFSTGKFIDSLSVAGEVLNAFTLNPEEEVFVMLYSLSNDTVSADSLPVLMRPLYVSKSDKEGRFRLQYLKNEPMKLFALRDLNSNYLFDLPEEEIAFVDKIVVPEIPLIFEPDTTDNRPDSLVYSNLYQDYYTLKLFQQIDSTQRLIAREAFYPPGFRLIFKYPVDSLSLKLMNYTADDDDWKVEEWNAARDSLRVWLKQIDRDSLSVQISLSDTIFDTVQLIIPEKSDLRSERQRRRSNQEESPERLKVFTNVKARLLNPKEPLKLTFEHPLISFDGSQITIFAGQDTLKGASFDADSKSNRSYSLKMDLEEENSYVFIIPDSAFFNLYGQTNDSLRIVFSIKPIAEFGNLFINLQAKDEFFPLIIRLLDGREAIVHELYLIKSAEIRFDLLTPATYTLKAIHDQWPNKRWDTGNYWNKRQPEDVLVCPIEFQIRSNWDVTETWLIE